VSWTRAGNLLRVDAPVRSGATARVAYRRTFHHGPGSLSNIERQDALLYADWLPVISFQPAPSRITVDTPAAWESIAQGVGDEEGWPLYLSRYASLFTEVR